MGIDKSRHICFFTGKRGGFTHLVPVIERIEQKDGMRFSVVAADMHLAETFGKTIDEVEKRTGNTFRVDTLLNSDSRVARAKSIGIAIMAMVSLGALTDGLVDEMTALAGKTGAQLVGMQADASIDLSTIDEQVVRHIVALPGVEHAEGFLTGYASIGDLPFFVVFGHRPRGYSIRDFRIVEGEPLTASDPVGVATLNSDLRVTHANTTFAQLVGLPIEALIGRPAIAILPNLGRPRGRDALAAAFHGAPGHLGDMHAVGEGGREEEQVVQEETSFPGDRRVVLVPALEEV